MKAHLADGTWQNLPQMLVETMKICAETIKKPR